MTILEMFAISVAVLYVQIWSVVFSVASFIQETVFVKKMYIVWCLVVYS